MFQQYIVIPILDMVLMLEFCWKGKIGEFGTSLGALQIPMKGYQDIPRKTGVLPKPLFWSTSGPLHNDICCEFLWIFRHIYPSQRQNLLPTLEISTQNFQNFHNFQNFGKKFQNLEFFSKISKTTKGPPLTSKGPPPPHYPITKFSFFSRVSKARGI